LPFDTDELKPLQTKGSRKRARIERRNLMVMRILILVFWYYSLGCDEKKKGASVNIVKIGDVAELINESIFSQNV
jgi:hypothetical protein